MIELFANSGDPDQMPHSAASDLGLLCLPFTHLGVSSLQWANQTTLIGKNLIRIKLLSLNICKLNTVFITLIFAWHCFEL